MDKSLKSKLSEWDKQPVLDHMLSDLMLCLQPDLLKEEYKKFFDFSKANKKQVEKYRNLLLAIQYAWQKTQRYELYFTVFYPTSDEISKIEALNHHIQAYLQDSTILKNKIVVFLGVLKNEVPKTAINSKDVKNFFRVGIETVEKTFAKVAKHRDPHTHKGMRFFDGQLIVGENAETARRLLTGNFSEQVDKFLSPEKKKAFFEKLKQDEESSLEKTKNWWINNAKKNGEQATGMLNATLSAVRPAMYTFLKIKSSREVIEAQIKKDEKSS